jgi:Mor family transcriptional regulator
VSQPPEARRASHMALHRSRRPCIRDTLDVDELVSRFESGMMIKELAHGYSISQSSVKRLLRSQRRDLSPKRQERS